MANIARKFLSVWFVGQNVDAIKTSIDFESIDFQHIIELYNLVQYSEGGTLAVRIIFLCPFLLSERLLYERRIH